MNGYEDPYAGIPLGTSWEQYYGQVAATPQQAAQALAYTTGQGYYETYGLSGVAAPAQALIGPVAAGATALGIPAAIVAAGAGLAGYLLGGGGEPGAPTDVMQVGNGGAVTPFGMNREAYLDFGGVGKYGREGTIAPTRTTEGTGFIAADTFRAWDPIKQRYYQLEGPQAYSGISFAPGSVVPGAGYITKTWITNAWRKDGSLATTQMAMLSNGRCISLSEDGRMKQWRPYKSIVLGKSMRAGTIRRFANRVKSHTKSLKTVLRLTK